MRVPDDFSELADQLAAVASDQQRQRDDGNGQLTRSFSAVVEALARVRENVSAAAVLDIAARELCGTGVFDRVMVSLVNGSTWLPQALYRIDGDGSVALELSGAKEDLDVQLLSPLAEAEVVRRRLPALIQDAQAEPRVHRPLVERTGAREYVVAPIVSASSVIGLLHADNGSSGRVLSTADRDLLQMFADGISMIRESADLAACFEQQRREIAAACAAATQLQAFEVMPTLHIGTSAAVATPADLDSPVRDTAPTAGRGSRRLYRLTMREREVLALLASGATNAQLADKLTVAESTVKSHVKHILHKLGAGNRAAAIALYLRESRLSERPSR